MDTIYKYPIKIVDKQIISMPKGAKILSAQFQTSGVFPELCVWAMVDDLQPNEDRIFRVFGTGNHCYCDGEFIATAQDPSRPLVWHIFVSK